MASSPSPVEAEGSWAAGRRFARAALAPVERFLAVEASSGIVLLSVALVALVWANSRFGESYAALWHLEAGVKLGPFAFERPLHFWINDALMTIFFFVVGLEIRRELHRGELSELKRAALPLAAALGGMVVPACIFLLFNRGETARGWGVPMATDIAFAVGVLALLGKRVPPALRVLLLALAVIDDVGSIVVIAIFYSSKLELSGFGLMAAGMASIVLMQRLWVRQPFAYVFPSVVIWAGAYVAGIHPTLAGVIIGLMTPVKAGLNSEQFLEATDASAAAVREIGTVEEKELMPQLDALNRARRDVVSPVERLQHLLHGWVAYAVMPLFAFANAGVALGNVSLDGNLTVLLGVVLGLVVGKPIGILLLSFLAVRLGWAVLPRGLGWLQVSVVGLVGGVGFTMAIFIAQLAFAAGPALETAKLGILIASGVAAVIALVAGRVLLPEKHAVEAAATAAEAEASTEA